MLNVDGNQDELVTLTAGGNDDDARPLGTDDDAVRAIHNNDRAVPYTTKESRLTPVGSDFNLIQWRS